MPAAYVKSLADKYKIPIEKLEKYWKEAKKVIKDYGKYDDNDDKLWGTVVKIFKNKINKHLNLQEENKMLSFKQHRELDESLEDEIIKGIADKVGEEIAKDIDDDLIAAFKAKVLKRIKSEVGISVDSEEESEGEEEIDGDDEEPENTEEGEETEGEGSKEVKNDSGEEDEPEEETDESEESEEGGSEENHEENLDLPKEDEFVIKIAKENDLEINDVLSLWNKAKKESKYEKKDNQYWNSVDKIFKKKIKEVYDIEL